MKRFYKILTVDENTYYKEKIFREIDLLNIAFIEHTVIGKEHYYKIYFKQSGIKDGVLYIDEKSYIEIQNILNEIEI
jgi:hypothetical protein